MAFRLHNAQRTEETTPQGMVFRSCGLSECLGTATEKSGFLAKHDANREAQAEPTSAGHAVKRGIGMASLLHVGGGAKIYRSDGCGTILKIDDHAHVTVITGSTDIGQGSETVIAQLVGEELGLPVSAITVINNDTEITPWDVGVHASRTTFIAGNSARGAARKARDKLLKAAGEQLAVDPDTLDLRQGRLVKQETGESLLELGKLIRSLHFAQKNDVVMTSDYYEPPSVMQDGGFKGDVSASYAFGTQVVELEVDIRTGVIRILKVTTAHDVGKVINALGIEGQIEGGVVMGMGYAIAEHLWIDTGCALHGGFTQFGSCEPVAGVRPLRHDGWAGRCGREGGALQGGCERRSEMGSEGQGGGDPHSVPEDVGCPIERVGSARPSGYVLLRDSGQGASCR